MVLLLSLQLRGCVAFLARDASTRAFRVDAVHLALALHASHLLDGPTEGALARRGRDGPASVSLLCLHPILGGHRHPFQPSSPGHNSGPCSVTSSAASAQQRTLPDEDIFGSLSGGHQWQKSTPPDSSCCPLYC